jgi:hypothetical protein
MPDPTHPRSVDLDRQAVVAGRLAAARDQLDRLDAAIVDAGDGALARHAAAARWLLEGIEDDMARQAAQR